MSYSLFAVMWIAGTAVAPVTEPRYFGVHVVDEQTGRGVPLVELRTVNEVRHYTDSAGWVAIDDPGLMGQEVFVHVTSHGYEYPADGFGYRGARLQVTAGGTATVKVHRVNIAERLYRVTGGGVYRDSVLLGKPVPIEHPTLNGLVFGQDSVVNTVYRGRIYWFWGDTAWPRYPLGNFQVAGATSRLPGDGGLPPGVGVNLSYFVDERGFAKEMAPIEGHGPTWIDGLVTLRDAEGTERLFAVYAKVRPDMSAKGRGFLRFDDQAARFRPVGQFDPNLPLQPGGHPFIHSDDRVSYVYFTRPFPVVRVRAEPDAYVDPARYECFTCLQPGCDPESPVLDRDDGGRLRWTWKRGAPPLIPRVQEKLLKDGILKPAEARFRLHDVDTGKPVIVHGGSVYWNEYRQRWVMVASEIYGTSILGEIWFAEADSPIGPWRYARKIVTHDQYSFYNPKQHPMFDELGGRVIYFEGTYTDTFSGNTDKTPRYNYNQIMYRLDLADPRTALPVAVYRVGREEGGVGFRARPDSGPGGRDARDAVFFAPDQPTPGSVAVVPQVTTSGSQVLHCEPVPETRSSSESAGTVPPLFYSLPADMKAPPVTTTRLYAFVHEDGRRVYLIDGEPAPPGYRRADQPLCRVWRDPRLIDPPTSPDGR